MTFEFSKHCKFMPYVLNKPTECAGLVIGNLKFKLGKGFQQKSENDAQILMQECNHQSKSIPSLSGFIEAMTGKFKYVLVVEKETVFDLCLLHGPNMQFCDYVIA